MALCVSANSVFSLLLLESLYWQNKVNSNCSIILHCSEPFFRLQKRCLLPSSGVPVCLKLQRTVLYSMDRVVTEDGGNQVSSTKGTIKTKLTMPFFSLITRLGWSISDTKNKPKLHGITPKIWRTQNICFIFHFKANYTDTIISNTVKIQECQKPRKKEHEPVQYLFLKPACILIQLSHFFFKTTKLCTYTQNSILLCRIFWQKFSPQTCQNRNFEYFHFTYAVWNISAALRRKKIIIEQLMLQGGSKILYKIAPHLFPVSIYTIKGYRVPKVQKSGEWRNLT